MNALWVFTVVIGVVAGDVGLGYHYKVPQTSYGVPTYQTSAPSGTYNSGLSGSSSGSNYHSGLTGSSSSGGYNTGLTGSSSSGNYHSGLTGSSSSGSYNTGLTGSSSSGNYHSGLTASSSSGNYNSGLTGSSSSGNYNSGLTGSSSNGNYNSGLSGGSSNSNYNSQYTGSAGTGSNYYTGQSSTQGDLSSTLGQNSGYQTGFQSAGSAANIGSNSNYYQTSGFVRPTYQTGGDYSAFNQYQTSSHYQSSAADKYQQYYNVIQQQPAQVFKHYYVHAAPEEPESPKSPQPIVLPPAQKHYKIIFIKAPTAAVQAPQIIPVQQQNEEKTIVYVLVKKPEEAQDIVLPKIEQKTPSKPEVYFIKYNNKHDSQAVINNIVTDLNKGGSSDLAYTALSDTSHAISGTNQEGESTGQISEQVLSLTGDQGLSSGIESSSLGSSNILGSTAFGSGISNSNTFGFDSSTSSFGSSPTASSSTFGSSSTGDGSYGSSDFGSTAGLFDSSSNAFGSSYVDTKDQSLSIATVDSGAAVGGYDSSSGSGVSSTASTLTGYDASAISTSQGVPHETYGPPKFKVL